MYDLQLMYRECGAETRDDYLRELANENGLPLACVRRIADRLGEREDFGALYQPALIKTHAPIFAVRWS